MSVSFANQLFYRILITLLLFSGLANALTNFQVQIIKKCYAYGAKYGLGNTLAGICWVESKGGLYLINETTEDYGIAGINIRTALRYLKEKDTYWNRRKVKSMLVRDDDLVLKIAIHELLEWKKRKRFWFEYVSAYNRGTMGSYKYSQKVARAIRYLKKHHIIKRR